MQIRHAIVPLTALLIGTATPTPMHSEEIHLAARKGDAAAIEQLIADGVPVDLPSTRHTSQPGVSPLYVAAQFGRVDAVKVLLAAGADPEIRPTGEETDGTPMHMAARRGKIEVVTLLLDHGADPNIYDTWLGTPLHQARLNDNEPLAEMLIARGAETHWRAQPITEELRNADLENGKAIARGCGTLCHTLDPDVEELSLWNILGAAKTGRPGYAYSPALAAIGGDWSYEDLNSFLASPFRFAPGTGMYYSVPDAQSRADVIAYLRTLSNAPVPLP